MKAGARNHEDRVLPFILVNDNGGATGPMLSGLKEEPSVDAVLGMSREVAERISTKLAEEAHLGAEAAAATAWFDPFPPGPSRNSDPRMVSPQAGRRGVRNARSATKLPMIVTHFSGCTLLKR